MRACVHWLVGWLVGWDVLGRGCRRLLTNPFPFPSPWSFQFGFQVTRKDAPSSPSIRHYQQQQKQQQQQQPRAPHTATKEEAEAAAADMAHALPHALLLLIGWACLVTGALQMLALPPGSGGLRLAYAINMAWAALVLSGLWAPVGQVLEVGVPCWCVESPSAWLGDCIRRAARRAGYVPIAEAEAAAADGDDSHGSSIRDVEAGEADGEEKEKEKGGAAVVVAGKPPRHPLFRATTPAPAPPLSPPAVQPGQREEGNNELWRKRQGSPPPAVEEGTPLLRGGSKQ